MPNTSMLVLNVIADIQGSRKSKSTSNNSGDGDGKKRQLSEGASDGNGSKKKKPVNNSGNVDGNGKKNNNSTTSGGVEGKDRNCVSDITTDLKNKLDACPIRSQSRRCKIRHMNVANDNITKKAKKPGPGDIYYEPSSLVRLQAKVPLNPDLQKDSYAMRNVLSYFTSLELKDVIVSVDESSEDGIYSPCRLEGNTADYQTSKLKSFGLGVIVGITDFISHFDSRCVDKDYLRFIDNIPLDAEFRHYNSELDIVLFNQSPTQSVGYGDTYKVKVKYDSIHSIYVVPDPRPPQAGRGKTVSSRAFDIFLVLDYPPLMFQKTTSSDVNVSNEQFRTPCFRYNKKPSKGSKSGTIDKLEYGKCNVVHLSMDEKQSGQDPWIILSTLKFFLDSNGTPKPVYFAHLNMKQRQDLQVDHSILPSFLRDESFDGLNYSISCSTHYFHNFEDDLLLCSKKDRKTFWQAVREKWLQDKNTIENVFFDIFRAIMRCAFIRVIPAFNELVEKSGKRAKSDSQYKKLHDQHFLEAGIQKIRRGFMTPTRLLLFPPHHFVHSKVLKDMCDYRYAFRMTVRDDDERPLNFNIGTGPEEKQKEFLAKMKKQVIKGLKVGSRTYEYLATSNSQMREGGMLLYAKDKKGHDAKHYRGEIGFFKQFRCVGKYIARVGQSFSQMMVSFPIEKENVSVIKDVKGGDHPVSHKQYTFTDGVGKISNKLRDVIVGELLNKGYLQNGYVPSAFQIRYRGVKGIVVVDPYLTEKDVPEDAICLQIRDSMVKFASTSKTLAVLKFSAPRSVFLNRNLINILDQLKTPRKVFHELLTRNLKAVYNSFIDDKQATRMIKSLSPQFHMLYNIDSLNEFGVSILSEPFFRKVVDIVINRNLRDLREKMRIPLEMNEGRLMFGVVDEYGVLEYGQVFIKYTDEKDPTKTIIHSGEILVTKNPCMHPGDVRKFQAVDHPKLHHHEDCIVFPRQGKRPHPNEMAGSDLDGDEYVIIFRRDLFFPGNNYNAMDFPDEPVDELPKGHEITVDHVLDFFYEFIRTNCVGLIANTHLALSDRNNIFTTEAMDLAEMYSKALDFSKTGRNVVLKTEKRAKHYPDFMEKGHEKSTYKSDRVLGQLYRKVCAFQLYSSDPLPIENDERLENPLLIHPDWKEYEGIAMADFNLYASQVTSILKETSVESEASLMSVILSRDARYVIGKEEGKRDTDLQDMMERIVSKQFDIWRQRFLDLKEKELDSKEKAQELMKKASAYYIVQYKMNREVSQQRNEGRSDMSLKQQLYGFAWIAAKELACLAQHMQSNDVSLDCEHTETESIETILEETITKREGFSVKDAADFQTSVLQPWLANHPVKQQLGVSFDNDCFEDLGRVFLEVDKELSFLESPAKVIVKVFERLVSDWLACVITARDSGKKKIEKERKGYLAMAALVTLSRLFRQKNTNDFKEKVVDMNDLDFGELRLRKYHISLVSNENFKKLVENNDREILNHLKTSTNVMDISGRFLSIKGYQYWLIIAFGTKCQLDFLHNRITDRDFYIDTAEAVENLIKLQSQQPIADDIPSDSEQNDENAINNY